MLVMGTTGSGKTASVVLPSLFRLLEAGHCGIIIDVKGNLREQTRAFARQCGREADLVEFGSAPSATPLNLLCGMDLFAVRSLFQAMTMDQFEGASNNKDFHMKGVHLAGDCVRVLRYLAALDVAFEPTVSMVASMITDFTLCAALFKLFEALVFDKNKGEHRRFKQRIECNEHHILTFDEKKLDKRGSYLEQITYNTNGIRMGLTEFLETPGIARGFATQGAPGLDLRMLLAQNKIVLLRFSPDTGPIGASLARMLVQEYYKAVYATGLDMAEGTYSFACLDEFQDFAELGRGRFSDTNFIAQAREFHAIFLASTQSMSALVNRGNSLAAVTSFSSNCNARVLFYSDDPLTQSMVTQYDNGIQLNALRSGEVFVVQYDTKLRKHSFGIETLQQAYETTRDILQQGGNSGNKNDMAASKAETVTPSLFELLELVEAKHKASLKVESASTESVSPSTEKEASPSGKEKYPVAPQTLEDILKEEEEDMMQAEVQERVRHLFNTFPQYFPAGEPFHVVIPQGWLPYVEKAFRAFADTGLKLTISSMMEKNGALIVWSGSGRSVRSDTSFQSTGEKIMNALLRGTRELCPLCGSPVTRPQSDTKGTLPVDESLGISICAGCLAKHGMLPLVTGMEANGGGASERLERRYEG
jgi:hypothetical protein